MHSYNLAGSFQTFPWPFPAALVAEVEWPSYSPFSRCKGGYPPVPSHSHPGPSRTVLLPPPAALDLKWPSYSPYSTCRGGCTPVPSHSLSWPSGTVPQPPPGAIVAEAESQLSPCHPVAHLSVNPPSGLSLLKSTFSHPPLHLLRAFPSSNQLSRLLRYPFLKHRIPTEKQ